MEEEIICHTFPGATQRLVLLHGWGADADDLVPLGIQLCKGMDSPMDVVSMRAPHMHPEGVGRQWYGLFPPNWLEVPSAQIDLHARLQTLPNSQIPLEKTVLFGFSQGGAMALAAGCDLPLAGLIGCSAYPHPNWRPPLKRPPILLTHGNKDDVVPYSAAEQLIKALDISDIEVNLILFEGGHGIAEELIAPIQISLARWLK